MRRKSFAWVCGTLILVACEEPTESTTSTLATGPDAALDTAEPDSGLAPGRMMLGPEGGTLTVGSITVIFQPQSVVETIEVGLELVGATETSLPSSAQSEVFELTPLGTTLTRPALVRIRTDEKVAAPVLVVFDPARDESPQVILVQLSESNDGEGRWESELETFGVGYLADAVELQTLEVFMRNPVVAQAIDLLLGEQTNTTAPSSSAQPTGSSSEVNTPSSEGAEGSSAVTGATSAVHPGTEVSGATGTHETSEMTPSTEGETSASDSEASGSTSLPPTSSSTESVTGTSSSDLPSGTEEPALQCSPGNYIAISDADPTVRSCLPCPEGYFSTLPDSAACSPWQVCPPGQIQVGAPSATADRVCGPEEAQVRRLTVETAGLGTVVALVEGQPVPLDAGVADVPLGAAVELMAYAAVGQVVQGVTCVGTEQGGSSHSSQSQSLAFAMDDAYDCLVFFVPAEGAPVLVTMSEVGGTAAMLGSNRVCSATANDGEGARPGTVECRFETPLDESVATFSMQADPGYRLGAVEGDCVPTQYAGVYNVELVGEPTCDVTFDACLPAEVSASLVGPNGITFEPDENGVLNISRSLLVEFYRSTLLTMTARILENQTPQSTTVLVDGQATFIEEGGSVSFDATELMFDRIYELAVEVPWCDTSVVAERTFLVRITG